MVQPTHEEDMTELLLTETLSINTNKQINKGVINTISESF